jgi:PTH1 family peptidyl-tRNA hydrolase
MGFRVVDELSARWACPLAPEEPFCRLGRTRLDGQTVLLAKPVTYMNNSGLAAEQVKSGHGLSAEEILVVVDCIDLAVGRIRLRPSGGAGGHQGLASVIDALGTEDFPRLRVGVGRPPEGVEAADYVLDEIEPEVERILLKAVTRAADAVEVSIRRSLTAAMDEFNSDSVCDDGSSDIVRGGL